MPDRHQIIYRSMTSTYTESKHNPELNIGSNLLIHLPQALLLSHSAHVTHTMGQSVVQEDPSDIYLGTNR